MEGQSEVRDTRDTSPVTMMDDLGTVRQEARGVERYDDQNSVSSGRIEDWIDVEEPCNQTGAGAGGGINDSQHITQMMHDVTGVLREVVSELKSLKAHNQEIATPEVGVHSTPVEAETYTVADAGNNQEATHTGRSRSALRASAPEYVNRPEGVVHASWDENNSHASNLGLRRREDHRGMNWGIGVSRYNADGGSGEVRRDYGDGPILQRQGVKIPPFTRKEDWGVWLAKFEAIAYRYRWGYETRLDYLLPLIEGQASKFVFAQLPKQALCDYNELTTQLTRRYRVIETSQSFAAKFSRRNQKHGESAEAYAADLKRLYDKAHGHRDRQTRDEDLVRRFLDGLMDQEAKFVVEYHKEPKDIDEAVFHVVNMVQTRNACSNRQERPNKYQTRRTQVEAHQGTPWESLETSEVKRVPFEERKTTERELTQDSKPNQAKPTEGSKTDKMLEALMQRIEKLEETCRRDREQRRSICFNCNEEGHFSKQCPKRGERHEGGVRRQEQNQKSLNSKGPSLAPRGRSSN